MRYYLLLIAISLFGLSGCSTISDSKEINVSGDFVDKEWLFYDEVTSEQLCLNFGSDGIYFYHCECGEPVGNSDLYDRYDYNEEAKLITLFSSSDNATDQIEVLEYNTHHLMLRIDGEVKDFTTYEMDRMSNFWSFEGEEYISGYNCRCTVIDIQEDKIICGPVEYDPEGINEDGPFEEYQIAEDVEISELYVKSYNSIQDDQEYEEYYEVIYNEMNLEEFESLLENGFASVFLWFDDELKVKKIMGYGQLSVTADYVAITVPGELTEGITQKYLDEKVDEGLCDVAHMDEDGFIFFLMDRDQYEKLLPEFSRFDSIDLPE